MKLKLLFASLQSKTAKQLLEPKHLQTVDTIILKKNEDIYTQSSASLRAISELGGFYKLTRILLLVPPFIRNWIYKILSRNRYKWFGRKEVCRMPSEADAGKILS